MSEQVLHESTADGRCPEHGLGICRDCNWDWPDALKNGMGIGGRRGMGGHHKAVGATDEWYTPPAVFDALSIDFALDPCAPLGGLPWIPSRRFYSIEDDGLNQPWEGRVWLNPPYGQQTSTWMRRLAAHGDGIGLAFARTDTAWFHAIAPTASVICFIEGRLTFVPSNPKNVAEGRTGNAGAPSMLIAYGDECGEAVARSGLGMTFTVRSRPLLGQASIFEVPRAA